MKHQAGVSTLVTIVAIVLVLAAVVKCNSTGNAPAAASPAPTDYAPAARAACAQMLQKLSRDPSSFDPIEQWNWATLENGDGSWSVLAHYRAKNGAGGTNVEKTTCVMTRTGDTWTLQSHARMQ